MGACTADVGISDSIPMLHKCFKLSCKVAGMRLAPRTGTIILVSNVASRQNIADVRLWVSDHGPEWVHSEIVNPASNLGTRIRPTSGQMQWKSMFIKLKATVDQIADHVEHAKVAILAYILRLCQCLAPLPSLRCLPVRFVGSKCVPHHSHGR